MTTTTTTRHSLHVLPEIVPLELRVRVQTRGVTALPLLDDLGFGGGLGLCGVMVSSASAVVSAAIFNITSDIMIEDGSVMKIVGPKGTCIQNESGRCRIARRKRNEEAPSARYVACSSMAVAECIPYSYSPS